MSDSKNGVVRLKSKHSFTETYNRLESAVAARGRTIFARIDFAGDAERAGIAMKPTRLLIFGNPRAGTPLMVPTPSLALDFPLKVLVSEDGDGSVWVSYNSPEYLRDRHGNPSELLGNISGISSIVESAV